MASIKLVYINSTGGYVQSSSTVDEASGLGKLTLAGVGGVAIDAGAALISNVATPVSSGDVAIKSYVDALVNGLTWVSPVVVVATSAVTLSGSQTIDGVTPINGSRVLITGQNGSTPDAANGIYLVNTSGAWSRSSDTLRSGTAMFVQSGSTYADTQWVLTTDAVITPGVTAIIFAQAGAGVSYSAGSGINIVGTTISAKGDSAQAINVDATNGIQVKADTAKALSIDATNGLQVKADTAKALAIDSTNGLQVKVDTSKAVAIDATNGVQVKADAAKALAIDATNGLQVLADTAYALTIDATTGLRVNNSATGGLNFTGGGALQVKIANSDQLSADASGLAVTGVPSQFKINGSAVSTNVDASNLNTLTNSTSITTLHRHGGLFAAPASTTVGVSQGDPVYMTAGAQIELARADSTASAGVLGISIDTYGLGQTVTFQTQGACNLFSGLTAGVPYYLGNAGSVVPYSSITSGNRAIRIGYAVASNIIILNIQDMGVKP
jgi:hypothetical protein